MRNIILAVIIGILTLNFVSSTLTETKIDHAIPIISNICPSWNSETITNLMYEYDCSFGDHVVNTIQCGSKQIVYRCSEGTHSINGIDLTTLPDVQITDSNINVDSPHSVQTIDKSQKTFNFKLGFEISLAIASISLIGNIIQFVRNKKIKKVSKKR